MTTPAIHGTRVCSICHETKPVLAFAVNRATGDQLSKWCRACQSEKNHRQWVKKGRGPHDYRLPERA